MPLRPPFRVRSARPLRGPLGRWARWAAVLLGVALLAACSEPAVRKRTFVGQAGAQPETSVPVGLNPVGALDTCLPGPEPEPLGTRVLISRPELFSRRASEIVAALRDALALAPEGARVELLLSALPLVSAQQAREEGRRCGAMLVVWEREQDLALEMTLPHPTRIPLRHNVPERLCTYGGNLEQANILYFTILALASTLNQDYDQALFFLNMANRTEQGCLRLPLAGVGDLPEHGKKAQGDQPEGQP